MLNMIQETHAFRPQFISAHCSYTEMHSAELSFTARSTLNLTAGFKTEFTPEAMFNHNFPAA
jgi:hypothetical protein